MEQFRRRYTEAKQADDARNTLIEDLLQKVDDMQKTMDRNAFVLVLIDGDNMNFLNDLVKQGIQGGDEAAKRLRRSVFEYLRYDEDFKHDYKIVIRVYANIRGLCKTYAVKGVLPNTAAISDFVLGFNKAHPLCDFVDAGNQKEAADTKLKEILTLHIYNVHCKHIIFGASADNAYPSFLSSFSDMDTDVSQRIRILKGPPFSFEFRQILNKFRWTEFKDVFRSEFISDEPSAHHGSHAGTSTRVEDVEPGDPYKPWPWISRKNVGPGIHDPPEASGNTPMFEEAWSPYDSALNQHQNQTQTQNQNYPKPQYSQYHLYSPQHQQHQKQPNELAMEWNRHSSVPLEPREPPQPSPENQGLTAFMVEDALIRATDQRLQESPRALDFGVVKSRVEEELSLRPDFWDSKEWFSRSKNIIKMTVEEWVERTDNPPPKNATWMLRFFQAGQSPSAVMKDPSAEVWRTRIHDPLSHR